MKERDHHACRKYEPWTRTIGITHCGWKPVAQQIVKNTMEQFRYLGSRADDIFAYISPGGGDSVYRFSLNHKSLPLLHAHGRLEDFRSHMTETEPGVTVLQLNKLVARDLADMGVPVRNITNDPLSCITNMSLHSYRRDVSPDMATSQHGLGIGVIMLK